MRSELKEPYMHLEIAREQRGSEVPLTGKTSADLAAKLRGLCQPAVLRVVDMGNGAVQGSVSSLEDLPRRWLGCASAKGRSPGGSGEGVCGARVEAPNKKSPGPPPGL